MRKSVVIFSGGQDSTTCLLHAKLNCDEVHAITFDYGQRHSVELEQATLICKKHDIKHIVVNIDFLGDLVNSALTQKSGDVNALNEKGLPASFVPNRNLLFLTLAHAYAQKVGAEVLVTGVCETDFSGYPDCRQDFIDLAQHTMNKGSDSHIRIITPLMHMTKAQTFELARHEGYLDDVIEHSHTCYNGDREKRNAWGYGCGECPACKLREKGFNEFLLLA